MDTSIYKNKEIESFLESEYMSIQEGESRILEFLKNREKVVDKTDLMETPRKRYNI